SIKNDGHYFCRAGGNRPDGLNEPVTIIRSQRHLKEKISSSLAAVSAVRILPQTLFPLPEA
ncbi:hypothetical protein ACEA32_24760, partial [Escherichia coli]